MKSFACLATISAFLVAAVACAPGAGAEAPAGNAGTIGGSEAAEPGDFLPTSTPWPQFGPPPVTSASITATVQAAPQPPGSTNGPGNGSSTTVPTATPFVIPDGSFKVVISRSPVPSGGETPLDTSSTFDPLFEYTADTPLDWQRFTGDDEIVFAHESGDVRVTVRERRIDRGQVESILDVAQLIEPSPFLDWSQRSVSDFRVVGPDSYRIDYSGTRLGQSYVGSVEWNLWGQVLVEVVTEARALLWNQGTSVRGTASFLASSLANNSAVSIATESEIKNLVKARFTQRPSNIFSPSGEGFRGTELSCREVFIDLLSDPVYLGAGEWQVFAVTGQGAQVWQIFEPDLEIFQAAHNTSSC